MNGSNQSLTFLSLASQQKSTALIDTLLRLGYHIDPLEQGKAGGGAAQGQAAVLIVLFGPGGAGGVQMRRWLDSHPGASALGVIPRDGETWDGEALGPCTDFVFWPCDDRELRARLRRFAAAASTAAAARPCEPPAAGRARLEMIGRSRAFRDMVRRIEKMGAHTAPVLILGTTGTGKEVAARAIHYLGPRRARPFIPVNCGAIPDTLIESELFGHVRGAFTDAKEAHVGLVAQAAGGSLLLDEIETLSPRGQIVLLRFLQDQLYRPVGGSELRAADVRVIAASNADLEAMVAAGRFREDLLYRLTILTLILPPLSERREDIVVLAEHFLRRYSDRYEQRLKHLSDQALAWMLQYDWPGNVRELENFIHRGVALADGEVIDVEHAVAGRLESGSRRAVPEASAATFHAAKATAIATFERQYLHHLLRAAAGNVTLAARRAGKERRALGKLLKKHGIDPRAFVRRG